MSQLLDSPDPRVSVVIVNFNGCHHLERCLASLSTTTGPSFETIVFDNGSTDGSLEWLQRHYPGVRLLLATENVGFGAANQQGVEAARAEYVAFLNNDTAVEPEWLAVLVRVLDECHGVAAACSLLKLMAHDDIINANGGAMTWVGHGFDLDFGQPSDAALRGTAPVEQVFFPTAAAMVIRKRDFVECGGFDPTFFMYHEDVDLGWRLWLTGKRAVVCRESVVYHRFGGTSRGWWGPSFSARLGARHNLRSLIKNYDRRNLLRALYRLNRTWIGARSFRTLFEAWSWNLRRLPSTLRERVRIQRARVVSDRSLFEAGLIVRDKLYPPPQPRLPIPSTEFDSSRLLVMPVLRPGEDSALGRLREGWYPPEVCAEGRMRRTSGVARCVLRVAPRARGVVSVVLRLGRSWAVGDVCVEANGRELSVTVDDGSWRTVSLETMAADDGLLTVVIRTLGAKTTGGLGGPSPAGCAVREVAFDTPNGAVDAPKTISVVIPTYNRWDRLQATLDALDIQTHLPVEVVVVDDGSTDGTRMHLESLVAGRRFGYPLRIHRQENAGPGSARNAGVLAAGGDLVLFLGDDTTPDPGCLQAHLDMHQKTRMHCAVVGFTDWCRNSVRVTPFLEVVNTEGYQFGYGAMQDGHDVPLTCFYASNISLPRWIMLQEPFHPIFTHAAWEDTEVGYRLALAGLRIVYTLRAVTRHAHPMTVRSFLARMRLVGQKSSTIFGLHPGLRLNTAILPPNYPVAAMARLERWLRWLVPVVDAIDRCRVRLPSAVYRLLVMANFCQGIESSRSASPVRVHLAPTGYSRKAGRLAEQIKPQE